ncbi:MAG: imidazoleglycerol-phosphate dehydratase HisB [Deltaproteobacteria bacterium]|nr:imidazoleglycerol-phosphate dehydratase HisB [Deltaproteobacteria bacterium]
MVRKSAIHRNTTETDIIVEINCDGTGESRIATTVPFLDHMLCLVARHGLIDLSVRAAGDTDVDYHHLVEDVGICLGQALREALGDKRGIGRYGFASVPMDESLSAVSLDLSGRPCLVFNAELSGMRIRDFDLSLVKEFFKALVDNGGITLHINAIYGRNSHHIVESMFKAFARALREAMAVNERICGIMSTKGRL